MESDSDNKDLLPRTRGYQQEMLDASLRKNIIIAMDTGSGKTHIAILRMKLEAERKQHKVSWFLAPTVGLCEQQRDVIAGALPLSVGLVSGALEPDQWKDPTLWNVTLSSHRIIVSTPQVLLDALRHGYVDMGKDIGLLTFDEAHHATDKHPYNMIMREFYDTCTPPDRIKPFILGLTASPIFGGNVRHAFSIIERNLDCVIMSPRDTRTELDQHVHHPQFKHVFYPPIDYAGAPQTSQNLCALIDVVKTLNIHDDPSVHFLREKLLKSPHGSDDYKRLDQKLSRLINKEDSFIHKGLKDFRRAAEEICGAVGPWAADWYIETVVERALKSSDPNHLFFVERHSREKAYLLQILKSINLKGVSREPDAVFAGTSSKAKRLILCLLDEKAYREDLGECYSGLVFVTRRDAVLALAELLIHHPSTKGRFTVGCLIGSSESSRRNSFLDITRTLQKQSQAETLAKFRVGEQSLLVSTAVAEEGIDIQACGSVIRWDIPQNMVSWAQSRGRARRKQSTFILMFEEGGALDELVRKWEVLEREMITKYLDESRHLAVTLSQYETEVDSDENSDENDNVEFRVERTGATVTLNSAISHLAHFCSVLPCASHVDRTPIFDIYPPDYPLGFHTAPPGTSPPPNPGPFSATLTLPRLLPPDQREHSVEQIYWTKLKARKYVAFKAYVSLYHAGLLNDHLLPHDGVIEQGLDVEVKTLLTAIGKREGMANVTSQMDPWGRLGSSAKEEEKWFRSEMLIEGVRPSFTFLTKVELPTQDLCDTLHDPEFGPRKFEIRHGKWETLSSKQLLPYRLYTRRLFSLFYGARMQWENLGFAYLFLPSSSDDRDQALWEKRRLFFEALKSTTTTEKAAMPKARVLGDAQFLGEKLSYPNDVVIVADASKASKLFWFREWRHTTLTNEEEAETLHRYSRLRDVQVDYPVIVATPLPKRMNFLKPPASDVTAPRTPEPVVLLPQYTTIALASASDVHLGLFAPSILRATAIILTSNSLRNTLFKDPFLSTISLDQMRVAVVAPAATAHFSYERLETLGDTILKFLTGLQLFDEHPAWHEGYLTLRKDHAVSNVKLAHCALKKQLYHWIVRNPFVPRKWRPDYDEGPATTDVELNSITDETKARKTKNKMAKLSTKVLADVVEALIGAAFLSGGLDGAIECIKVFDIGIPLKSMNDRINSIYDRVELSEELPPQLTYPETMLGYTFTKKLFLVEALMHASCQSEFRTVSYERLEFLGDSILDVVVTGSLYRAEGKEYSPGHMHIRKCALVNVHFLAFICLRTHLLLESQMPMWEAAKGTSVRTEMRTVYLWQCLLHSSHRILDDQSDTFLRFMRGRDEIERALFHGTTYPWAALTRLQAPKLFSDMIESLLGAIYLDSKGNMDIIYDVLEKLGILPILRRVVSDDVDVRHPVSRISDWVGQRYRNERIAKYCFSQSKGLITCSLFVGDEEVTTVTERYNGRASQEEVKFRAAEAAMQALDQRAHHDG